MALLSRDEILDALVQLGRFAVEQELTINLLAVGGAVMAIRHNARLATRDVDVLIRQPEDAALVRRLAQAVAADRNWPGDWLNDAAKGYLCGSGDEVLLFEAPGIEVYAVSDLQLLAMKLSAWRDDVDIADARLLLRGISGDKSTVWSNLAAFLVPGKGLKAQYAFDDLWEERSEPI